MPQSDHDLKRLPPRDRLRCKEFLSERFECPCGVGRLHRRLQIARDTTVRQHGFVAARDPQHLHRRADEFPTRDRDGIGHSQHIRYVHGCDCRQRQQRKPDAREKNGS
ncbi:MAG TPA: hypothetical protein DEB30_00705 [Candidatus Peribacter riflensis]|nr:hypothetical protein [Candidatus Peribacter riflensis]